MQPVPVAAGQAFLFRPLSQKEPQQIILLSLCFLAIYKRASISCSKSLGAVAGA